MKRTGWLRGLLADHAWRYPLLFGLGSVPFTVAASEWGATGGTVSLGPVVLAAVLVGYLYDGPVDRGTVGARTGLLGGLPTLTVVPSALVLGATITSPPWPSWYPVILVVFATIGLLFGFAVSALLGLLGAKVGGWLARRTGRRGRPTTGV